MNLKFFSIETQLREHILLQNLIRLRSLDCASNKKHCKFTANSNFKSVITMLILKCFLSCLIFNIHLWFPWKFTFYLEISRFTIKISGTIYMKTTLNFAQLNTPLVYHILIEVTKIDKIPCDKPSVYKIYSSKYSVQILLHCRFFVFVVFTWQSFYFWSRDRTKNNNDTNMNSNITLLVNLFGYLFDNVQFWLNNQTIEQIHNLEIVINTFLIWKIMN